MPMVPAGNLQYNVVTVSASATISPKTDVVYVKSPTANVVLTLPTSASVQPGKRVSILKDATATYTVTVNCAGADHINGGATSIAAYGAGASKATDVVNVGAGVWVSNPVTPS